MVKSRTRRARQRDPDAIKLKYLPVGPYWNQSRCGVIGANNLIHYRKPPSRKTFKDLTGVMRPYMKSTQSCDSAHSAGFATLQNLLFVVHLNTSHAPWQNQTFQKSVQHNKYGWPNICKRRQTNKQSRKRGRNAGKTGRNKRKLSN